VSPIASRIGTKTPARSLDSFRRSLERERAPPPSAASGRAAADRLWCAGRPGACPS